MFLFFKILPDWIWWLLLLTGFSGFFASYLGLLKPYQLLLKIAGTITIAASIFILGMLYADNTWKQAAKELQAKVDIAEAKSKATNETIKTQVITKTQVIKTRGEDVVRYVDREVVKYDNTCVIPKEFIHAHNRAAEQLK